MAATATSALRQLFNMFARPRPPAGALTMETPELLHFLRALGQAGSVEAACASLLARYGSREHAGALDFPAFELLVAQEALGPRAPAGGGGAGGGGAGGGGGADTELARVFARADADGDGLLSAAEVAALLGADGKPVGDAEVAAVMEEAGASAEGKLSLAQFLQVNLIQTR
jgi:hypothetical protein